METMTISAKTMHKDLLQTAMELGPMIGQNIDEEEKDRRLSEPVVKALKEAGLLRLYLPKSLGGLEMDPVTTARLVEQISLHNTAAGWLMMVANTSSWWNSRLSPKGVEQIYGSSPDTIVAGAFHPPMKATPVDGGFLINGRSPLTSNVHLASWIFVTAFVMEGEQIKMQQGIPQIIGVCMNPQDCGILDTWFTLGMKATDSNDVEAKDVFVPHHLSYPIVPDFEPNSYFKSRLYQFAAIGASIASLIAPVSLAVARNAITELMTIAGKKMPLGSMVTIREKGVVQRKLGMAEALVQSSRAYLYHELSENWDKVMAGKKLSLEEKAALLSAAAHSNQSCLQAVDMVYSAAGTSAIYTRSKLAHYFTDAQVIRQHGFVNDSRYETAGQIYLGIQPDLPVVAF